MNLFTTNRVAAQASPFNCAWIPRGSVANIGGVTYAVCTRMPDFPRTVSEEDCLRCPFWEDTANIEPIETQPPMVII